MTSTENINLRVNVTSRKTTMMSSEYSGDVAKCEQKGPYPSSSWQFNIIRSIVCVICGMVFGIALHKAHVMEPIVIRHQMLMQQFTMLKFFLSGLATSMFVLSMLAMLPFTRAAFISACKEYFDHMLSFSVASSIVGGTFMGLGMTISGSCPSAIFSQLGAMVPNAHYTFLGALTAVLLYCLMKKPIFDVYLAPSNPKSSNPWANSPYFILALPIVAMFGITALAFETLIPSENEIKFTGKAGDSLLAYNVWPPYICGMLVGGLQLPVVLLMDKTLGGSTSVSVMVGQLFAGPLEKLSPYAAKCRRWKFENFWQVFYVAGAVLGGYVSATASGVQIEGVSPLASYVGGFCLYMGARIGGGCTSGNGLSGMGLLSILSFIMIASTFASGMTSAVWMHWYKIF